MTGVSQRSSSSTTWGMASGFVDELAAVVGMLGEVAEEAVERGRHGVEAGDEEQEADVEDVVAGELVAVDLGVEELAQEVVAGRRGPLVEQALEVLVDRVGRRLLVGDRYRDGRPAGRRRGGAG